MKKDEKTIAREELGKSLKELARYFFRRGFNDGFLVGIISSFLAYIISAVFFRLVIK